MNIVIFDESISGRKTSQLVQQYGYHVTLCSDKYRMIDNHILFSTQAEVYLLEVGKNLIGLKLADKIIAKNNGDIIIFVTWDIEQILFNPYQKVYMFSTIHKSNLKNELEITLLLGQKQVDRENLFIYRSKFNHISIKISDISLIESIPGCPGKLRIHHKTGIYEIRESLKTLVTTLGSDFIRCHKSYIINKKNVHLVDKTKKEVEIADGTNKIRIPFGRNHPI